jgi:SAM-dependent methyltransferase
VSQRGSGGGVRLDTLGAGEDGTVPALRSGLSLFLAVAKNAGLAIPGAHRARERRLLRRGLGAGALTESYAEGIFGLHAKAAVAFRPLAEADVLEIGPGGSLGVLELFQASGVRRATAIDVLPWIAEPDDRASMTDDADRTIEYLHPVSVEDLPFPDESFDFIYSHSCFQYVRDPEAATREIKRVLRVGGVTTHLIDMRDRAHEDGDDPLQFLRYRDWQWQLATSHRLFQPNRWRTSDYVDALQRNGFEVTLEVTAAIDVDDAYRATLAPPFRRKRLDDLATVGCFIVARA